MEDFKQSWVGYLDRSYEQIKKSLISRMPQAVPEITDMSESNPFIVLVSFFSGMGEMLNYYIDGMAREAYIGTARRYSSVIKIAQLLGYRPKLRNHASADLLFTLLEDTSAAPPTTHTADILIPKGTRFQNDGGLMFVSTRDKYLLAGRSYTYIPVVQSVPATTDLGQMMGVADEVFQLFDDTLDNSEVVSLDGDIWKRFDTKYQMMPDDKGYYILVDESQRIFILFGDGVHGLLPPKGATLNLGYRITSGSAGNVQPGTINALVQGYSITVPAGKKYSITNPKYAVGGTDTEDIEQVRNLAPRSFRTLERAVTYQDYKDIALLEPGVLASEVRYCCGKFAEVFVLPYDRGEATSTIIDNLEATFDMKSMLGVDVTVKPAGLIRMYLVIDIILKPLITEATAIFPIYTLLDQNFGMATATINKTIFLSDISNVLENSPLVESAVIASARLEPYVRINTGTNPLNIVYDVLPHTTTKYKYTIRYIGTTGKFQVLKEALIVKNDLAIDEVFSDSNISFHIKVGSYIDGDVWELIAYPSYPETFPTNKIEIKDFNAAIIEVFPEIPSIFSKINFIEQGQSSPGLPPCN